jgi:hypothetical protein
VVLVVALLDRELRLVAAHLGKVTLVVRLQVLWAVEAVGQVGQVAMALLLLAVQVA